MGQVKEAGARPTFSRLHRLRNNSVISDFVPLDAFVGAVQRARANHLESKRDWRRRSGKDFVRWRPEVGESIDVLCVGTNYGIDAEGRKWRLPQAKDILNAFKGQKGAWFRVTRVETEGKERHPYNDGKAPSAENNKSTRVMRPHRRTGRKSPGRPARLRFAVEHIVGPEIAWSTPVDEGRRDATIFRLIVKLHLERFSEEEVLERALDLARRCSPPFDEDEVRSKVKRVFHPEPMTPEVKARIEAQRAAKREARGPVEVQFRDVRPLEDYLRGAQSAEESLVRLWGWLETAFRGRPDRYAYYVAYGKSHPRPTKTAAFTPPVLLDHLTGSAKGLYLVDLNGTVSVLVFDIDAHVRTKDRALVEVRRICDALHQLGAAYERNFVVEDSGNGFHIFLFIQPIVSVHAGVWGKRMLDALGLGIDPQYRSVLPPPTGGLGTKGLGPLIRLPLGLHPKTGTRSRFLAAEEVLSGERVLR